MIPYWIIIAIIIVILSASGTFVYLETEKWYQCKDGKECIRVPKGTLGAYPTFDECWSNCIGSWFKCDGYGKCNPVPTGTFESYPSLDDCKDKCKPHYKCNQVKQLCELVKDDTLASTTDFDKCSLNCCSEGKGYSPKYRKCKETIDCSDKKYNLLSPVGDFVYKNKPLPDSNKTQCYSILPKEEMERQCDMNDKYGWNGENCVPTADCSSPQYGIPQEGNDFIFKTYYLSGSGNTVCDTGLSKDEKKSQCDNDPNYEWMDGYCYRKLLIDRFLLDKEASQGNHLVFRGDITNIDDKIVYILESIVDSGDGLDYTIMEHDNTIRKEKTEKAEIITENNRELLSVEILRSKGDNALLPGVTYTFQLDVNEVLNLGMSNARVQFTLPKQTKEIEWKDIPAPTFLDVTKDDYNKIIVSEIAELPTGSEYLDKDKFFVPVSKGVWTVCLNKKCVHNKIGKLGHFNFIIRPKLPLFISDGANNYSSLFGGDKILHIDATIGGITYRKKIPVDRYLKYIPIGPFAKNTNVKISMCYTVRDSNDVLQVSNRSEILTVRVPSFDKFCEKIPFKYFGIDTSLLTIGDLCIEPDVDDLKYNCLIQKDPTKYPQFEILRYSEDESRCVPTKMIDFRDASMSCRDNYNLHIGSNSWKAGCWNRGNVDITNHKTNCNYTPPISKDEFIDLYKNTKNRAGRTVEEYWKSVDPSWSVEKAAENMYPCENTDQPEIVKYVRTNCSGDFDNGMRERCCNTIHIPYQVKPGKWSYDSRKDQCTYREYGGSGTRRITFKNPNTQIGIDYVWY